MKRRPRRERLALSAALSSTCLAMPVSALGGPPPSPAPADGPAASQATSLAWLLLRSDAPSIDAAELQKHLELRLRDTAIRRPGQRQAALAPGESAGLVHVRGQGESLTFTLVLTDGRAYDRRVEDPGPQGERALASEVVSLLRAVLEQSLAADRFEDADFLEADEGESDPTAPEGTSEASTSTGEGEGEADTRSTATSPAVWIGARVSASFTAGLAPARELDVSTYGGAGLALDVAWPRGGVLTAAFSAHGRGAGDSLGVRRFRGGAGGGYRWGRGAFEWLNVARVELEGWRVVDTPRLFASGRPVRPPPTLLGLAWVSSPGFAWRRDRVALRAGPRLELAMRGSLSDPRGAPRIYAREGDTDALARLGGLELGLGLELQLWFGAGKATPRRAQGPS